MVAKLVSGLPSINAPYIISSLREKGAVRLSVGEISNRYCVAEMVCRKCPELSGIFLLLNLEALRPYHQIGPPFPPTER